MLTKEKHELSNKTLSLLIVKHDWIWKIFPLANQKVPEPSAVRLGLNNHYVVQPEK